MTNKLYNEKIKLEKGDITTFDGDTIVNAANKSLLGGGGVDGAIHKAGGKEILKECMKIGGCDTGEAVITTAGQLKTEYVIHTVGPIWRGGEYNEDRLLANCYKNSLKLAVENNIKTIAFPNISTGVYRFPKGAAAKISIDTVNKFLENSGDIEEVVFMCFDNENYKIYEGILGK